MEFSTVTNDLLGALSKFGLLVPISVITAMGLLALYIWNRTRSTHSLMSRLWQLFHGKRDCTDKKIAAFLDGQSALMQFRFTTGVYARTNSQSHSLIAWTERNNEDMAAVAACGPYFDLEKVALSESLPGWRLNTFKFVMTMILALTLTTSCIGIIVPSAILQFKESRQFFTFTPGYAKPLWNDVGLSKDQCNDASRIAASGFTSHDAALICDMFKDPRAQDFVSENLLTQRTLFGFLGLNLLIYFVGSFRWLMQGLRAYDMRKRMRTRCVPPLALEAIPE